MRERPEWEKRSLRMGFKKFDDAKKKEYFALPNLLSYLRILLVPLFAWLYCAENATVWAAAVLILSALTDVADGIIARKFDLITEWGKVVDPLADKLTEGVVTACLLCRYWHLLFLLILIVIKEVLQGIGGLVLYRKMRKMQSSEWFGKLSTVCFYVLMGVLALFSPDPVKYGLFIDVSICVSFALMFTVLILYFRRFCAMWKEWKQSQI